MKAADPLGGVLDYPHNRPLQTDQLRWLLNGEIVMLAGKQIASKTISGGLLCLALGCTLVPLEEKPVVADAALSFLEEVLQVEVLKAQEEEARPFVRYELSDIRPSLMAQRGFLCQAADQNPRLFEAAIDYLTQNKPNVTTDSLAPILGEFEIIGKNWPDFETSQVFEEIREFRKAYPTSPFLTLSLPGFSEDRTVAVFYYSSYSGGGSQRHRKDVSGFHAYEKVLGSWEKRDWYLGIPYPH